MLLLLLAVGSVQIHLWETGLLLLMYVAYVLVTFYVCRGDEPVHADHHHHELPLEDLQGGWGVWWGGGGRRRPPPPPPMAGRGLPPVVTGTHSHQPSVLPAAACPCTNVAGSHLTHM
jgi:Ca2+/Na+ antiporter